MVAYVKPVERVGHRGPSAMQSREMKAGPSAKAKGIGDAFGDAQGSIRGQTHRQGTTSRRPHHRAHEPWRGRIFLDFLRNGRGNG